MLVPDSFTSSGRRKCIRMLSLVLYFVFRGGSFLKACCCSDCFGFSSLSLFGLAGPRLYFLRRFRTLLTVPPLGNVLIGVLLIISALPTILGLGLDMDRLNSPEEESKYTLPPLTPVVLEPRPWVSADMRRVWDSTNHTHTLMVLGASPEIEALRPGETVCYDCDMCAITSQSAATK